MSRLADLLLTEERSGVEDVELRRLIDFLEQDTAAASQIFSGTGVDFNQAITMNRALTIRSDGGTVGTGKRGLFLINNTSGSIVGYSILQDDASGDMTMGIADRASLADTQTFIRFRNVNNGRASLFVKDDEIFRVSRNSSDVNIQDINMYGGSNGGTLALNSGGQTEISIVYGRSGETRFNAQSRDIDFAVNGDNVTDVFVVDAGLDIASFGTTLRIKERAAALGDTATYGQLWVKDATPNQLFFTNDAGTDVQLGGVDAIADEQFVVLAATADLSNERVLTGTSNQVTITDNGAGSTVVLSTPQDIATGSSVQFGALNLSEGNITNVGQIDLDLIRADAANGAITIELDNFAGADLLIGNNNALVVEGDNDRVGIGTASPTAKLGIDGEERFQTALPGTPFTQTRLTLYRDSGNWGYLTYGNDAILRIIYGKDTGGRLVIGQSSALDNTGTITNRLIVWGDGAITTHPGTGGHAVFNEDSVDADFRVESDGNTHALFLQGSDGKVGIGTASPGFTLEVNESGLATVNIHSTTSGTSASIELGTGGAGNRNAFIDFVGDATFNDFGLRIIRGNIGANSLSTLQHRGTGDFRFEATEAAALSFITNALERVRVNSDGNVGVGTASPNQLLTVEGTISLKEQAEANADTGAYGQIWVNTATPNELFFTDDAGTDFKLGTGNSEWTDTGSLLHPADLTGAETVVIGGTTAAGADIIFNADGSAVFNEQGAAVDIRFEGDGEANLLFLDGSADSIGIGISSPIARFHLHGGQAVIGDSTVAVPAGTYGPLFVWRNPSSTAAGEAAGIRINISGNDNSSPAINDYVGLSVRTTNDGQANINVWGANILAQAANNITGNKQIRAAEFEISVNTGNGTLQTDPYSGSNLRGNGVEIVAISGSSTLTTGLTTWANTNGTSGWWTDGISLSRAIKYGISFRKLSGDADNPFKTSIFDGSSLALDPQPFWIGGSGINTHLRFENNADHDFSIDIDSGSTTAQVSFLQFLDQGTVKWWIGKNVSNELEIFDQAASATALTIVTAAGIKSEYPIKIKERAAAVADTEAYGQLWVKTATPNQLWFTDDAGTDTQIV